MSRSDPRVAVLGMNVRHFDTGLPAYGGGERYTVEMCRLLRDLGYTVDLFQSIMPPVTLDTEFEGMRLRGIPHTTQYQEWLTGVSQQFTALAKDKQYDRVLYLVPEYASGDMVQGKDAVVVIHGVWFDDGRALTDEWRAHWRELTTGPAHLVTVDTATIQATRLLGDPDAASRMTYIPNFVRPNTLISAGQRRSLPYPVKPDVPHILIPRRACVPRGSRLLAPLLRLLPKQCEVRWVGSTHPMEAALVRKVCGRDPRASFAVVPFSAMPAQYAWADIVLIPTVSAEGTSLACLEAMEAARIVIASNVGGLPDLIRHEVNGLLVAPTASALAGAVQRVLDDWITFCAMAERAWYDATTIFSLAQWRRRWTRCLREWWSDDDMDWSRGDMEGAQ